MNKVSLFAFALIVVLPGCNGNKKSAQPAKKGNIQKYINTEGLVSDDQDGDEDEATEDEDEDVDNMLNFEDEDGEQEDEDIELSPEDEEALNLPELEEDEESTEEEGNDLAFRWIDAQVDDELKPLYFAFNTYDVKADQKVIVDYDVEQVKQLLSESGTSAQPLVIIEGHACQEGTPAYNVALSEKRAKMIADLFVAAGVERSAIKVVGRGSECPAIINGKPVNGSREVRWPNRRVEVRVMYT